MSISTALSKLTIRWALGSKNTAEMKSVRQHHVVGSAPGNVSGSYSDDVWLTCVNASVARTNRPPNLWIITDQIFDASKNANLEALQHIYGKQTDLLLVVRRTYSDSELLGHLKRHEIKYQSIKFVGNFGRSIICQPYCGIRNVFKRHRPSNGVFAIIVSMILARCSEDTPSRVIVEGINPGSIEHFYRSGWKARGHITADQIAMEEFGKDETFVNLS